MKESTDIEAFAGLMARIDDPFADRAAVLAHAGLDERSVDELAASWRARLGDASAGALPEVFAVAYGRARAALLKGQHPTPSPLSAPTREVAGTGRPPSALTGASALSAPAFAETADISAFVPRIALPFTSNPALTPQPSGSIADAPALRIGGGTETFDPRAFKPHNPLPFQPTPALNAPNAAPPPPAPALPAGNLAPGRRLIRFDAQTGEPLPEPYWSDAPPGADEPAPNKIKK